MPGAERWSYPLGTNRQLRQALCRGQSCQICRFRRQRDHIRSPTYRVPHPASKVFIYLVRERSGLPTQELVNVEYTVTGPRQYDVIAFVDGY